MWRGDRHVRRQTSSGNRSARLESNRITDTKWGGAETREMDAILEDAGLQKYV